MQTITAEETSTNPMALRHAVQGGDTVALTFRGRTYGYVVPADQWDALNEERDTTSQGDDVT